MANAVEYVGLPEPTPADDGSCLAVDWPREGPHDPSVVGVVQARQLAVHGKIDLDIRYQSADREIWIGPFALDHFEVLLLMDAIKEGMDQMLLDHEAARRMIRVKP